MKWLVLFTVCVASTIARNSQPLRIRIRSEAAVLENGVGHVTVEFEANSKVDVMWCQEFPGNEGIPSDCVSLEGNPNFRIRKDVSLFYFSYMGSTSISTILTPFNGPPVLRLSSKSGNVHLDHKVIKGDPDLNGKVQVSRSKVKVPEIWNVLPPSVNRQKQPALTCSVQSDKGMQVTWLMTSTQGTIPLFQFNMAGEENKAVHGELYEGGREDKKTAEGIMTKAILKMTSPNTEAEVMTCVFSDEDKVNTVHISTLVEY